MALVVTPPPAGHIRIRLVTDMNDPLSFLIRLDTISKVSHSEAVLRDGSVVGAYETGVTHRSSTADVGSTLQMFVDIPCSPEQIESWEAHLLRRIGMPYDYAALAGFALHTDMHTEGHTICSALVMGALRHVGVLSEKQFKPDHRISPGDLATSLSFMAKLGNFIITPLGG